MKKNLMPSCHFLSPTIFPRSWWTVSLPNRFSFRSAILALSFSALAVLPLCAEDQSASAFDLETTNTADLITDEGAKAAYISTRSGQKLSLFDGDGNRINLSGAKKAGGLGENLLNVRWWLDETVKGTLFTTVFSTVIGGIITQFFPSIDGSGLTAAEVQGLLQQQNLTVQRDNVRTELIAVRTYLSLYRRPTTISSFATANSDLQSHLLTLYTQIATIHKLSFLNGDVTKRLDKPQFTPPLMQCMALYYQCAIEHVVLVASLNGLSTAQTELTFYNHVFANFAKTIDVTILKTDDYITAMTFSMYHKIVPGDVYGISCNGPKDHYEQADTAWETWAARMPDGFADLVKLVIGPTGGDQPLWYDTGYEWAEYKRKPYFQAAWDACKIQLKADWENAKGTLYCADLGGRDALVKFSQFLSDRSRLTMDQWNIELSRNAGYSHVEIRGH